MRELGCVDAQHGQIGVRVIADERCGKLAPVEQRDADVVGVVHDVAIGDDETVGGKDEAAAVAAAPAMPCLDTDDGGANPFGGCSYGLGIGVERRGGVDRNERKNHLGPSKPPAALAGFVRGAPYGATNRTLLRAQMAELVDALVSGTSDGNIVGVRVPFWAVRPIFGRT